MNKPKKEDELLLQSIDQDGFDIVTIPRTKDEYKVGWIKPRTHEKLSGLELKDGLGSTESDTLISIQKRSKFLSKAASYILLNGIKIFFFHWLYWRYLYHIKGYSADQLLPIIEIAKKKVPAMKFYQASILVSQMKITNMIMTQEEAEQFQREHISESVQP